MACGKPIILSSVCDAGNLVLDGKNGFLCDPSSSESMANAFAHLAAMSVESKALAECLFDEQIVIERYEGFFQAAVRREPVAAGCNWPAEVPKSAVRTVEEWANGCQARWE